MMGGLGDLNKVMPEIMAMSATTQTELVAIRELLEELVELQKAQLTQDGPASPPSNRPTPEFDSVLGKRRKHA
jgi:hypothetical protein